MSTYVFSHHGLGVSVIVEAAASLVELTGFSVAAIVAYAGCGVDTGGATEPPTG